MSYDHLGRLMSLKSGKHVREHAYDLNGNLRKVKYSNDGIVGGLLGSITEERVFDGHDRVTAIKRPGQGGEEVTAVAYFDGGEWRTRTVTAPEGGAVEDLKVEEVDGYGRPKRIVRTGDGLTATTTLGYAASESGLTVTEVGPRQTVTRKFDAAGRPREVADSVATRTMTPNDSFLVERAELKEDGVTYFRTVKFDDLDRRTEIADGVGILASLTPRLDGLPTENRDGLGNATSTTYSRLGEALRTDRPESLRVDQVLDGNRRLIGTQDRSGKGSATEFKDGRMRVTRQVRRDGSVVEFNEPNGLNLAEEWVLPGGGKTSVDFDGQGRVTGSETEFGGTTYTLKDVKFDALGRVRSYGYQTHDQSGTATFGFDKLGVPKSSSYVEGGATYGFTYGIRDDGSRTHVDYPSGVRVEEVRQRNTRLETVRVAAGDLAGPIWEAQAFGGLQQPTRIRRGGVLEETREYDARRRLVAMKVVRIVDGAVLSDWRYQWDAGDNLIVRQAVHEQGRADVFGYDRAHRLVRAHFGARPGGAGLAVPGLGGEAGLQPGFAARTYQYDNGGLDLLTGSTLVEQPEQKPWSLAPFPAELTDYNAFLFARSVDGVARSDTDALGNAKQVKHRMVDTTGQWVPATAGLTHNGRNELVGAIRGAQEFKFHLRPDHLLHRKTRTDGNAGAASDRALVWDQGVLREEYDLSASPQRLVARYYYADGDTPVAADLADAGGVLKRFHFLHDQVLSVTAVVDANGQVVERMHYDPWGQSSVELQDVAAPRVHRVFEQGDGSLLIEFTEAVLPKATGGKGIVTASASLADLFEVTSGGTAVSGEPTLADHVPGLPFGSVIRFQPEGTLSGTVEIRVRANGVLDGWGNGNVAETVSVPLAGGVGIRFVGAVASTRPAEQARSAVGNPFRFQGAYAEPDLGLLYLRARWYDPNTGTFLEQDPREYQDSVNPYAGLANAPTRNRDPQGMATRRVAGEAVEAAAEALTHRFRPGQLVDEAAEAYEKRIANYTENAEEIERYGLWFMRRGIDLEFIGAGASKIVFNDPQTGRAYSILTARLDAEGVMMNLRGAQIWDVLGMNRYHGIHQAREFRLLGDRFERPLIISDTARHFRDDSPCSGNGSIYRAMGELERELYLDEAQDLARRAFYLVTGRRARDVGDLMGPDWTQWGVDATGQVRMLDAPNTSAADLAAFWRRYLAHGDYLNNPE